MATGAASAVKNNTGYIYGTAAPARLPYLEPHIEPAQIPLPKERAIPGAARRMLTKQGVRALTHEGAKVSLFAIAGTIVVTALMIFVMLAQINLNELARETVKLTSQLESLQQQQRVLGIAFENAVDMKAIEQYAKDVLGMSKPEAEQVIMLHSVPADKAEIFEVSDSRNSLQEFGSFLTFLFDEYIR